MDLDYLTQSTVQSAKKSGGLAGLIKRWKSESRWKIPTTCYSKTLDLIENAQVSRSRCVETTHHHQCHFHSSGGNHFFSSSPRIFFHNWSSLCRQQLASMQWEVTQCSSKRFWFLTKHYDHCIPMAKILIWQSFCQQNHSNILEISGKWIASESLWRSTLLQDCCHSWSGIDLLVEAI